MKIKIRANSEIFEIEQGTSVAQFLDMFNAHRCVVELNGIVLKKDLFSETILNDGDALEIMNIVAGG